MEQFHYGLLIILFLLSIHCLHSVYIADGAGSLTAENTFILLSDSLHQVLSEFRVIRPIRTNSEGRFLSASVSAHGAVQARSTKDDCKVRNKRQTQEASLNRNPSTGASLSNQLWYTGSGRGYTEEEAELFYNVTVFGQELHLRLHPNARLVAPTAAMEWWEESGHKHSQPIRDTACLYTGEVSNMEDTSVAISNCDGLAGMIRLGHEEFFIEPLDQRRTGIAEEEDRREHIVYRSSAIIRKPPALDAGATLKRLNYLTLRLMNRPRYCFLNCSSCRVHFLISFSLLQVLLAVDYSVLLFHGRDYIQMYLLTFMNIVNEIYQDHSLGANINIVLVKIIIFVPHQSLEMISVGNAQKSLENVCGWSYLQQREQSHTEQHDHTIYLTKQEFGPSGYAPVTGMCQLHRSCVLVIEDGFSSAFVAAHETGHVLGMEHDGEANECADDVPLGSIMSPQVQASFYRYHWSRCSWMELHKHLDTYDCLRDDPFHQDWPALPQLPGFQYSMDQQCRFDFGPGHGLCTAYPILDPCKQLWCSDYENPFYCRTKKGPPLDGTKCGPGKHCFKGFCMKLTPDMLRRDGGWGTWSPYGSCSRTCGVGVRFRARRCDSPAPANGGRTCFGNSYEFQLCSQEECPPLTDFRSDQCKAWNPFYEHEGKKHHWLPYQHPDPDERCRLFCQSNETGAVVSMNRMVHDGTLCSYDDAHSICVQGECESYSSPFSCFPLSIYCKIIKGNFTRSTKKEGYLKILEVPKGARHLLIQEFTGTPHVLAVKNQDTGHLFLNNEYELPESRVVIEKGVVWDYSNTEEQESIQTTGPLNYEVLLMVTVSYKYIIQNRLRSSLESKRVHEDALFFEWALKKWSHCSKPCGGGKQYTRFGCRRKADSKMVPRMFCSNINKPRAISRNCNIDACNSTRWVTGEWEDCSASCGQTGWQRRWVSCQQTSSTGQHQRAVHSKLCGEDRPDGKQPCNRFPCPASWRAGPWTPCSVSCGNGTQERQVVCSGPQSSVQNCSGPQPLTTRICQAPSCNGRDVGGCTLYWLSRSNSVFPATKISSTERCRADRSVFCRMEALSRYCSIAGFRQMCCKSCAKGNYDDYEDYSSYGVLSPSDTPDTLPTTSRTTTTGTTTTTTTTTTSKHPTTAPPHLMKRETTTPATPSATAPIVPAEGRSYTLVPPRMSAVPEFPTTESVVDIITTTSSSNKTSGGGSLQSQINLTVTEPMATSLSPSFFPFSRRENNSVDEVSYRIVGLDGDISRGQQNYFVPRMPPFRERTQNKRIQQLLNEKRRHDLLRRTSRSRKGRTDRRHDGL
uniref:Uncharacterized protein n=1 Tax=Mola mola TaxID=94237 RepID=A0A3Q3XB25_MOLML